jgi:hypothetical protein
MCALIALCVRASICASVVPPALPTPNTQFTLYCYTEILSKLEKRDIPWERYYDMSSQVRPFLSFMSRAWPSGGRQRKGLSVDCVSVFPSLQEERGKGCVLTACEQPVYCDV